MRPKITAALMSLALALLGAVAIAPPANASSGGTFCFHQQDDSPFANKPVSVDLSSDMNNWYTVLALQTDENGCSGFTLSGSYTEYYVRASVDWYWTGDAGEVFQHWFGTTGYYQPGQQADWMYSNVVYCASVDRSTPCR
ncbi:hypothetical protein [Arthrobacter sp. KBS0702]|uniref:hypothetical protein n=1 Tax=Arthrobacter sp. KBS0702 TaxID=2578107 RepID=UPI001C958A33|nr:hypothetical protein [Arthrobacter sp. KBS0702]